jgi:exodeoxyribonuclease VII large subunit
MFKDSLFSQQVFSVSEVTGYIRILLEENQDLQDIWIQGEISNLSFPSSGHIYFTLKDENASLRCVIWKWTAQYLHIKPADGMAVDVHGKFGVYEKGGQYQFYVDAIRSQGEGRLFQEFLRLKDKLEAEGLFAAEKKKEIPAFPHILGVVTSPTGAALQDILNTLRNRFPLVKVLLAPTLVQGENAPQFIVRAIHALQTAPEKPDVILIARGGGSLEDLWSFNDEQVVRAVADSPIPIISGVGHETDFTLVDFASDLRAPTPTGAAVLAVPNLMDLQFTMQEMGLRLKKAVAQTLEANRLDIKELNNTLQYLSPQNHIQQSSLRLDDLSKRLALSIHSSLTLKRANLEKARVHILAIDPLAVLERGYALVYNHDNELINSVSKTVVQERLDVRFKDGWLAAEVKAITKNGSDKKNGR